VKDLTRFCSMSLRHVYLSAEEATTLASRRSEPEIERRFLSSTVAFIQMCLRNVDPVRRDDRFQTGLIGAWESIRTWDPQRGPWFSHAARGVRRAIASEAWAEDAQRRGVPLYSYRDARYGRLKSPIPEPAVVMRLADDESAGDEPSIEMESAGEDWAKTISQWCEMSPRFVADKSGRLHAYIWRVVIAEESPRAFAKEHGVTHQAINLQWNHFRREIKAKCQGATV
jgi:hypothetical protein